MEWGSEGEAEGWRWERCLQPCSSAAPTTSCKQFFSSLLFVWVLLLFLEPLLSSVILTAASCSIRSSAVKAKSERCRCEWVTVCHWVHRDCRECSENDDHRCSGYPIGAISCCYDQGLLLFCNALQCNINPEELSLAGLMKILSRENIRLRWQSISVTPCVVFLVSTDGSVLHLYFYYLMNLNIMTVKTKVSTSTDLNTAISAGYVCKRKDLALSLTMTAL